MWSSGWQLRNRPPDRNQADALDIAGDEAVDGKVDDAVLSERCTLERGLAGIASEMDVGLGRADIPGPSTQLVRGVGNCGKACASRARSTPSSACPRRNRSSSLRAANTNGSTTRN